MAFIDLKHQQKPLLCHKAVRNPDFMSRTVLVADPWTYVDLWLKRNKAEEAIFYWQQAKAFYEATLGLPLLSSPLTSYYCFLNATKALLSVKGVSHSDDHGVSGSRETGSRAALVNEKVEFKGGGVLPALSGYLGENENKTEYTLDELLLNLPYIHRAYCLTYKSQKNLFIPLRNPRYVRKSNSTEAWFCAEVEPQYSSGQVLNTFPVAFERDDGVSDRCVVRRRRRFRWRPGKKHADRNLRNLQKYHTRIRLDVAYIRGPMRLWYIKRRLANSSIVKRYPLTITFAAMHRMSELSRYEPITLNRYLESRQNYLLSEFIENAPLQFVDEIASEITGQEFMPPGIRT